MTDGRHAYPPDVMRLLRDTIPLLCRSKPDVVSFFRATGVPDPLIRDLDLQVQRDPKSVSKYHLAGTVLGRLNDQYSNGNDRALGPLRETVRRVVEWDNFNGCWPNDELRAKVLVADVRSAVHAKDTFTRIQQERDDERSQRLAESRAKADAIRRKREERLDLERQLGGLSSWTNVQARGKALESILNGIFALDGMLVREDFTINLEGGTAGEQIDGVVMLDGRDYLVEVKWLKDPVDRPAASQHLVRIYGRADVRGLMISASGYTPPAIAECTRALTDRVMVLSDLDEIRLCLEFGADLAGWLREKSRAASLDRQPYKFVHAKDLAQAASVK